MGLPFNGRIMKTFVDGLQTGKRQIGILHLGETSRRNVPDLIDPDALRILQERTAIVPKSLEEERNVCRMKHTIEQRKRGKNRTDERRKLKSAIAQPRPY